MSKFCLFGHCLMTDCYLQPRTLVLSSVRARGVNKTYTNNWDPQDYCIPQFFCNAMQLRVGRDKCIWLRRDVKFLMLGNTVLVLLSSLYKVFCCHEIMRWLGQLLESQMYALQTGGHCQKRSNTMPPVNNHGNDIFTLFIFHFKKNSDALLDVWLWFPNLGILSKVCHQILCVCAFTHNSWKITSSSIWSE